MRLFFVAQLRLVNSAHAADEPLITDRPDFTESPQVVPRGMVQIEGGATYAREGAARQTEVGELLVRVPVSDKAEVRIGVPSYLWQRDGARLSGFGDAFLGAKFALSDGDAARKKPALGLLIGTSLPTGRAGFGEDEFQPETALAASWELCPTTSFNMNFGYARPSDGGARFNQLFGSVSLGHSLNDKWGAFAELFGFSKADATRQKREICQRRLDLFGQQRFSVGCARWVLGSITKSAARIIFRELAFRGVFELGEKRWKKQHSH